MINSDSRALQQLRDESGVALPLALLGLIAVTLMVTGILLTSSTEVAISGAHQDATSALYDVEGALQKYVGQQSDAPVNPRLATGTASIVSPSGATFDIGISQLAAVTTGPNASGLMRREETYSLLATPSDGRGRSVGSLIDVVREASPIKLNLNAGLTLGANTTISGSANISDGSDSAACDSATAESAIIYSNNVEIDYKDKNVHGEVTQDTDRNSAELMNHVLNGSNIDELAERANIKFGEQFGETDYVDSNVISASASDESYRWGCPAALVTGCSATAAMYFPVVAVDAEGGEIRINGDYGQGTLIVLNGDLRMEGNFKFQGIIIVEGVTRIFGTPRIEGAVIGMGDEAVIDPGTEGTSMGNSVVRFNKCEIVKAQAGLTAQALEGADQMFQNGTYAWFEVVR
ncbi:MAG TPA: pilus assembly PilX N-terminal domain-containing protein [Longimicrobiaceae bacterium]|nr:pilus assembly PilX N-terminal domain-containing protein [Longimicrobiaceae bacterium]